MQPEPPELRKMFERHERKLERELRRDRPKLFRALEQFANIRQDREGWTHFRNLWPNFFPAWEYDSAVEGSTPSIFSYPYWLDQVWRDVEIVPCLEILFGIERAPTEGNAEEASLADLSSIQPQEFSLDWNKGAFRYHGGCDFQRALYLLFRESWRARVCEKCDAKFIARRATQKYCSTDCSENMQRELKRKWWAAHGETWRQERQTSTPKGKGRKNVPSKAR